MTEVICPYCKLPAEKKDSAVVYGRSYGKIYICRNYPECDAYVGTHKDTGEPLGTLANGELREWRKKAHEAFDPLWKNSRKAGGKKRARQTMYQWMRQRLNKTDETGHIAMFDIEDCKRLLDEVQKRKRTELKCNLPTEHMATMELVAAAKPFLVDDITAPVHGVKQCNHCGGFNRVSDPNDVDVHHYDNCRAQRLRQAIKAVEELK